MKLLLAVVLVSFLVLPAAAVEVTVSGGIDTADAGTRPILQLWTGYLDSRPDLMWRDTEWNAEKSRFWRDFDRTAPFVYQFDLDSSFTLLAILIICFLILVSIIRLLHLLFRQLTKQSNL